MKKEIFLRVFTIQFIIQNFGVDQKVSFQKPNILKHSIFVIQVVFFCQFYLWIPLSFWSYLCYLFFTETELLEIWKIKIFVYIIIVIQLRKIIVFPNKKSKFVKFHFWNHFKRPPAKFTLSFFITFIYEFIEILDCPFLMRTNTQKFVNSWSNHKMTSSPIV